jgi:hypothetical protein
MKKPTIGINLFFFDDQYDVQVYEWDVVKNQPIKERTDLTAFAIGAKEAAVEYIRELEKEYAVYAYKETNEDDGKDHVEEMKNLLIPNLATYVFKAEELEEHLEKMFYFKHDFPVKLTVEFDGEYMYIGPSLENDERVLGILSEIYEGYFDREILGDLFESSEVKYNVLEEEGVVHIHIPFKKFQKTNQ